MTAMDDALESSSITFDDPTLTVTWKELPPAEGDGKENVQDLGDTLGGAYTVHHSFDDGLPDPVTMTGSNDASGTLKATLIGRSGQVFNTWGINASSGSVGFSTSFIQTTLPTYQWGDALLMAVVIPSLTAEINQGVMENSYKAWNFVGKQSSTTMTMWLFSRRAYTGMDAPFFNVSEVVGNPAFGCIAVRASDPSGRELHWRMLDLESSAAAGSVTVHTQPTVTATSDRSLFLGLWGSVGGSSWSVADTATTSVNNASSALTVSRSALFSGMTSKAMQATRSAATDDVAMMTVVLEPFERADMGPIEFWSPFNEDSPVNGMDRDTAGVQLATNTVTTEGVVPTVIFNGIMEDITVGSDDQVDLAATSETRITLNKALNLPIIFGRREGGSLDFLAAWILARADRFSGPAPGPHARWWVPCYGSIHAGLEAPLGYAYALYWDRDGAANVGVRYPRFVEGPFQSAVWACHTLDLVYEVVFMADDLYRANEIWPWVRENYFEGQYLQDLLSLSNACGRISFWVRADPYWPDKPSFLGDGDRYRFSFVLESRNADNTLLGRVWFYMDPTSTSPRLHMGSDAGGTTVRIWDSSVALPTDSEWHQYALSWDFVAGTATLMLDGVEDSSNIWAVNGDNDTSGWYTTDQDLHDAGGRIRTYLRTHMPMSDVILETGSQVTTGFSDLWPTPAWPSFTVTTRPTGQNIEAIPDDSPVNAWDTLADIARNTLSMYRANEWDSFELLPPTYFGEPEQQAIEYVTDTEVNAQELAIIADPSKSRNVVTIQFPETTVDQLYTTCLAVSSSVPLAPGINDYVFTLDTPVVEIHGAAEAIYGSTWDITSLDFAEIAAGPGAVSPNIHYMTVNHSADGGSVVLDHPLSVSAKIRGNTQTTVTVRFNNRTGRTVYLANNYDSGDIKLPFLRILGYCIKGVEAYTTERDPGTIGFRRERSMEVGMNWIQDRWTAQQVAAKLVSKLSRPRPQVTVEVMGDPRRVPGQLVSLSDAVSTRAKGQWRVLGIAHNADGPSFTQTLRLVKVDPMAVWDGSSWDHSVWGE